MYYIKYIILVSIYSFSAFPDSSSATPPCHTTKDKRDSLQLSTTVNSSVLESPHYKGTCLTLLNLTSSTEEKIVCLAKTSVDAHCINQSSTATMCHSGNFTVYYIDHKNGSTTIFATGGEEIAQQTLRIKIYMSIIYPDIPCEYNGSFAGKHDNKYLTTLSFYVNSTIESLPGTLF